MKRMLVGLIGANIQKSLSPALHEDALAAAGIHGHYHLMDLRSASWSRTSRSSVCRTDCGLRRGEYYLSLQAKRYVAARCRVVGSAPNRCRQYGDHCGGWIDEGIQHRPHRISNAPSRRRSDRMRRPVRPFFSLAREARAEPSRMLFWMWGFKPCSSMTRTWSKQVG